MRRVILLFLVLLAVEGLGQAGGLKIREAGLKARTFATGLHEPVNLAIDRQRQLIYAGTGGLSSGSKSPIQVIDREGYVMSIGPALYDAYSVVVDTEGNVYIGSRKDAAVYKFDTGGKLTVHAPSGTVKDGAGNAGPRKPYALGLLSDGTLITIDGDLNLYAIDANGQARILTKMDAKGRSIAVAGNDDVYLTTADGKLWKMEKGSSEPKEVEIALQGKYNYVAIEPVSGDLFVTDAGKEGKREGAVYRIHDGKQSLVVSGFTSPSGIVFDGKGNLFVADITEGTLTEISGFGTLKPKSEKLTLLEKVRQNPLPKPLMLVTGQASDFEHVIVAHGWAEPQEFHFKLKPNGDEDKPWTVISRPISNFTCFRLGTTFTGLKVNWLENPTVQVYGVKSIDNPHLPEHNIRFDKDRIMTAHLLWVKQDGEWKPFYINNWFHIWRSCDADKTDEVFERDLRQFVYIFTNAKTGAKEAWLEGLIDPYAAQWFVDKKGPQWNVYGWYWDPLRVVLTPEDLEVVNKHGVSRAYHGRLVTDKRFPLGYRLEIINFWARSYRGMEYGPFIGDESTVRLLTTGKPRER